MTKLIVHCKKGRKHQPIFETKAWKSLEKELKKPPKLKIYAVDRNNEGDKKKAKLMQKLIDYQFKTNTNGFTDKYWAFMKQHATEFLKEEVRGLQVSWDHIDKALKKVNK